MWRGIPDRFPFAALDAFVVMPNHVHAILIIIEQGRPEGDQTLGEYEIRRYDASTDHRGKRRGEPCVRPEYEHPTGTAPKAVGRILQACKSLTTAEYIRDVRDGAWPPFEHRLSQRDYCEHVIRNDTDLFAKRRYIENNPAAWADDEGNPRV